MRLLRLFRKVECPWSQVSEVRFPKLRRLVRLQRLGRR
ncbi:PH domain-containing protein [Fibrobacter sp.]